MSLQVCGAECSSGKDGYYTSCKLGHMRWQEKCLVAFVRVHTSQRLARGETATQDLFESLSLSDSKAETELLLPSDSAIRHDR
jgi:hypothetical protein